MPIIDTPPAKILPKGFTSIPDVIEFNSVLKPADRAILRAISSFCWGDDTTCFPSNGKIARRANLSVRHVQRRMEYLHACRAIRCSYYDQGEPGYAATGGTGRLIELPWKVALLAGETPQLFEPPVKKPDSSNQASPCHLWHPPHDADVTPPTTPASPETDPGDSSPSDQTQQRAPRAYEPHGDAGTSTAVTMRLVPGGGDVVADASLTEEQTPTADQGVSDEDVDAAAALALRAIERNPAATDAEIREAGRLLARGLRDGKSGGYHRKVAREVNVGVRPAQEVIDAFDVTRRRVKANEVKPENAGRHFAGMLRWNDRERGQAAARPSKPPGLRDTPTRDELRATLMWFHNAGRQATDPIVNATAKRICGALGFDGRNRLQPRGYEKPVRVKELFRRLLHRLAGGGSTWDRLLLPALEAATEEGGLIDGSMLLLRFFGKGAGRATA